MTPLSLAQFREILRQSAARARLLWAEGLAVRTQGDDCGVALDGLTLANLSGQKMGVLRDLAKAPKGQPVTLPAAILNQINMTPGWLGRTDVDPDANPMSRIGAATVLAALAHGLHGEGSVALVLAHDPGGGVQVTL